MFVCIRYRELQADIAQEDSSHTINFINIDCTQLKTALVAHCFQWQAKLTGLLNQARDLYRGHVIRLGMCFNLC